MFIHSDRFLFGINNFDFLTRVAYIHHNLLFLALNPKILTDSKVIDPNEDIYLILFVFMRTNFKFIFLRLEKCLDFLRIVEYLDL